MIEQRLTILKSQPDPQTLNKELTVSCRLFKLREVDAYFLEPVNQYNQHAPVLGGYYDSMFALQGPFDLDELRVFQRQNVRHKKSFYIHDDIVKEAIFVSRLFQTEVLSSYANDEGDGFVAVANCGTLTHLRFEGFHEPVGELLPSEVQQIIASTDGTSVGTISATRFDWNAASDEQHVTKYQAYEAIKSPSSELSWQPFHLYIEGMIGNMVVYHTLSPTSPEVPVNFMLRTSELVFRGIFGASIPDPHADRESFQLVDEFDEPERHVNGAFVRMAKAIVVSIGVVFVLLYEWLESRRR